MKKGKMHFTPTDNDWVYGLGILLIFAVLIVGSPPIFLEEVPNNDIKEKIMFAAYDDQGIWGTGVTPEQALNDAKDFRDNKDISGLKTAFMSEQLADWVKENDGDVGCCLDGGILKFIDDDGSLL